MGRCQILSVQLLEMCEGRPHTVTFQITTLDPGSDTGLRSDTAVAAAGDDSVCSSPFGGQRCLAAEGYCGCTEMNPAVVCGCAAAVSFSGVVLLLPLDGVVGVSVGWAVTVQSSGGFKDFGMAVSGEARYCCW